MTRITGKPTENRIFNVDEAVRNRYSDAANQAEAALCCPVEYDPKFLNAIPQEILERDYGCGDPSRHVRQGEAVLDLGSGGGKICYIASQVVGEHGRVIGVDCNEEMLSLARRYQKEMGSQLGYQNVEFRKGKIQDLKLNLELLDSYLQENPVSTSSDWLRVEEHAQHLRESKPLIPDQSIDVVVSNCVLNLVRTEDRKQLFGEIFRVLKRGGRAVVSDIVSDEEIPEHLQKDAHLWSGCMSGAFQEHAFLDAFEAAGFYGLEILSRQEQPWAVVEGIEFRSMTLQAFKGKEGPCLDRKQAVVYNGPWNAVYDDDGHKLIRGQRMAVCDKTFNLYGKEPYKDQFTLIPPAEPVPLNEAKPFSCHGTPIRSPRESKKAQADMTILPASDCCGPSECC